MEKESKINFAICTAVFILIIVIATIGYLTKKEKPKHPSSDLQPPIVFEVGKSIGTEYEYVKIEEVERKSYHEIADDVIDGKYGDGKERIRKLTKEGYDVEIVQKLVDDKLYYSAVESSNSDEEYVEEVQSYTPDECTVNSGEALNAYNGEVQYNGHRETYYSQQVLPGDGLNIPGRHVAEDGTVRDGDGYICVAANESYLPYGSVVETSLGKAKVYDSGCDYGTIDIYTNW